MPSSNELDSPFSLRRLPGLPGTTDRIDAIARRLSPGVQTRPLIAAMATNRARLHRRKLLTALDVAHAELVPGTHHGPLQDPSRWRVVRGNGAVMMGERATDLNDVVTFTKLVATNSTDGGSHGGHGMSV